MIQGAWLTINRSCNMKCKWCYAHDVENSDMSVELARNILELLDEMNVKSLMIIGGEPTVCKDLFEIIRECKRHNFYTTLITNGIRLSDKAYIDKLIASGIDNISLSQKSYNRTTYNEVTGIDGYDKVLDAISNLKEAHLSFSVSHVLTMDSIENIINVIREEKSAGADRFVFSFCFDFDACQMSNIVPDNPYALWEKFSSIYPQLNDVTNEQISMHMGLPLCVCDRSTLDHMVARNQIRTVCQLLKRTGIVFDTEGNIIPCNAMHKYRIGRYGKDFSDRLSLEKHLNSEVISDFYRKLLSLPDSSCVNCDKVLNCGGGCIANWFNYSFSEFKEVGKDVIS